MTLLPFSKKELKSELLTIEETSSSLKPFLRASSVCWASNRCSACISASTRMRSASSSAMMRARSSPSVSLPTRVAD